MARKLSVTELNRLAPDELAQRPRVPLRILLDNIRSGNNVGSVLRTADGFRFDHVLMSGISVAPPHRDILKTSLGAERTVPWSYYASPIEAIERCRQEGYKVAIVEQTTEALALQEWNPQPGEKWLLVLGNEVSGVSNEVLPLADVYLEVPQFGNKHSFNVAVCGGMVAWHYMNVSGLSFLNACELS
jgi:tRNA G18 (ribose-2'-O)-methylase SpoU